VKSSKGVTKTCSGARFGTTRREEKGGHTCWVLISDKGHDEDMSTWHVVATRGSEMQDGGGWWSECDEVGAGLPHQQGE